LKFRYKSINSQIKSLIRTATREREENLVNRGDIKSFYKYVNEKLSTKNHKIITIKTVDCVLVNDSQKVADLLNINFSQAFTTDNNIQVPTHNLATVYNIELTQIFLCNHQSITS